jgi:hypothetical protein
MNPFINIVESLMQKSQEQSIYRIFLAFCLSSQ